MNPKIWGKHAWFFLHTITLQYPVNPEPIEKSKYKEWFTGLRYTIPCQECRNHYSKYIQKTPPDVTSRETLVKWLLDLHNDVNKRSGKKTYTVEDLLEKFDKEYNSKTIFNFGQIIKCLSICCNIWK